MKYSERDLNILTLTIYGEARGEPREGKVGVAWSARNRATADLWSDDRNDWWGEGIAGVCLRSCNTPAGTGQTSRSPSASGSSASWSATT